MHTRRNYDYCYARNSNAQKPHLLTRWKTSGDAASRAACRRRHEVHHPPPPAPPVGDDMKCTTHRLSVSTLYTVAGTVNQMVAQVLPAALGADTRKRDTPTVRGVVGHSTLTTVKATASSPAPKAGERQDSNEPPPKKSGV
ncbi:hypothetical protein MRX96_057662 [Rhipicephalus microplus]